MHVNDNELDTASTSSISTMDSDMNTEQPSNTSKNINGKIDVNKLLNQKQREQQTAKKQTPLEKYLDDYAKTLENKSPEELRKEKERLEWQKKMSLITSIILAILALVLLITACIFLPLMPALAIAIPSAIGAITAVASGIIDYNIINKQIDRVNTKMSKLQLKWQSQHGGNNKSKINNINKSNIEINESNNSNKNNVNADKKDNNIINNNNVNNNTQDKNEKKNINDQNIQNDNKNDKNDVISNNILANKKNSINSNKNDNSDVNNKKIHTKKAETEKTEINIKNTSNNNSNYSATKAWDIDDDNKAADLIYKQTQEQVLNGTLDLSNRPSEKDYEKYKAAFNNTVANPRSKANARQQMIKYEIWNQLSSDSRKTYKELIKEGKSPVGKLKEAKDADWQVNLYNEHLENEKKRNQSLLSTINPVNLIVSKNEKSIKEKRDAVRTAILKGAQQVNGIQLSGVDAKKGDYKSGAITNKKMNIKVNQK